jgi:pimeloyl-ACP methyl ester carboxylesterase
MLVTVDGTPIYCATGGRPFVAGRPTVLLVHGAGMDHTAWALPARWLAWHGWATLVPDLPGHGRSGGAPLGSLEAMAAWTARLLEVTGAGPAALVGHSMGGAIVLETAARHPERVRQLVLVGTAAAIPVHRALLGAAESDPGTAVQMMTEWGHGAAAKVGGNSVPGLWMTGAARALLGANRPGVLHTDLAACNAWGTGPAAAAAVRCPTLVVAGAQDMMTSAKNGRELAAAIAGAKLVTIVDCGHMIMHEAPDALLDALIGFLGAERAAA